MCQINNQSSKPLTEDLMMYDDTEEEYAYSRSNERQSAGYNVIVVQIVSSNPYSISIDHSFYGVCYGNGVLEIPVETGSYVISATQQNGNRTQSVTVWFSHRGDRKICRIGTWLCNLFNLL